MRRWVGCALVLCQVLALLVAAPSSAQCTRAADGVTGIIEVDRGDGVPVAVWLHEAWAQITVPDHARAPLTVEVQGTLAMRGTGGPELLSLEAGTFGGLTVDAAHTVTVTRARDTGEMVEVVVGLGGALLHTTVPCDGLTARHPRVYPRRRSARTPPPPSTLRYPRHARLTLFSTVDGAPLGELTSLRRTDEIHVMEEVGRWSRVQIRGTGVGVEGWVRTRELRPSRGSLSSRGVRGTGARSRCGTAMDTEHALAAPGTPVTIPGTERVWAYLESDESVLVRFVGGRAELFATPRARAFREVRGCAERVVLGEIDPRFLTREVVVAFGVRLSRTDDRVVLDLEHGAEWPFRADLAPGDAILAVDGRPIARHDVALHDIGRDLAAFGLEHGFTLERGGAIVDLPPIVWPPTRGSAPYREPSALELALHN